MEKITEENQRILMDECRDLLAKKVEDIGAHYYDSIKKSNIRHFIFTGIVLTIMLIGAIGLVLSANCPQ